MSLRVFYSEAALHFFWVSIGFLLLESNICDKIYKAFSALKGRGREAALTRIYEHLRAIELANNENNFE